MSLPSYPSGSPSSYESGNILFMILLAVALVGTVTAAIQMTSRPEGANIDKETLVIRASEIQQYANELERAVALIMQKGVSESDLRFAHPDAPSFYGTYGSIDSDVLIFHPDGGGADYRRPPADISVTPDLYWEFYGTTDLPEVGSGRAELIAVLPDVTLAFCQRINALNGYNAATQPVDTAACLRQGSSAYFAAGSEFSSSPNTVDAASFTSTPSRQGCVQCASDSKYHFFHVLMAR